jgi:hypothetical protein
MSREAAQHAIVLDRLSRSVLTHLDELPDNILYWPFPIHEGTSIGACATRFLRFGSLWVLRLIGEQAMPVDFCAEDRTVLSHSHLIARFEYWLCEMHTLLDTLPDTTMDLFVILPPSLEGLPAEQPLTVRVCLLHTIEHCAILLGHIQLMRKFLNAGEHSYNEAVTLYEPAD